MQRLTIFLSSTIYGFRDLRSALKDYLELRGCTVDASDYNDFAKDLEPHSYEACLNAIENVDLFVLFIGSRVGGLVDATPRKSITRAEYERAYKLALQGRLRIVAFVREEVWTHRETVKEMSRFLAEATAHQREAEVDIAKAPSKFMTDAENVISFIELVSRNAETSAAVKGEGPFPVANWLHRFSTFPQIRAVLDPLILAGLNVPQAAGRKVLGISLTTLLHGLMSKGKAGAMMPAQLVGDLVDRIGLHFDQAMKQVELDKATRTRLVMLVTFVIPSRAYASPLVPFLSDPLLLQYDPATGSFAETLEHAALNDLVQESQASTWPRRSSTGRNCSRARTQTIRRLSSMVCSWLAPSTSSSGGPAFQLLR